MPDPNAPSSHECPHCERHMAVEAVTDIVRRALTASPGMDAAAVKDLAEKAADAIRAGLERLSEAK